MSNDDARTEAATVSTADVIREVANRLGDDAASSDFLAEEVSDGGLSWFVNRLREYADETEWENR